jgi:RNA polymerase sigma factor (sigma-70 family)
MSDRDSGTVARGGEAAYERQIRAFVVARDRGDAAATADAWQRLVVDHKDRVRTWVVTWRHPGNGQGLPPGEYEDATQQALLRATYKLVRSFRGSTMGELIGALRTCAHHAAADHWRAWVRHERRRAGSLDDQPAGADGDGPAGRFDGELAAMALAGGAAEQQRLDLVSALDDAIARIPNEKQRKVIRMDRLGVPDDEIAELLGESVAYVYKLRERGLRKLKEVLDDDER